MDKAQRNQRRQQAAEALLFAEQLLTELVDSYTEEQDGKFSACHPRMGLKSTAGQIEKLRRALERAKV